MSEDIVFTSLGNVRRLAVTKQHLSGRRPSSATSEDILSVIRDIAYVQWDPISIVAPSHVISLWNRIGPFRQSDLEKLLWDEKSVFEHWTPIASIVLTEDYPLYYSLMRRYPQSLGRSWKSHITKASEFLSKHSQLRKNMLNEFKIGPLQLNQFKDYVRTKRSSDGWTPGSDVSTMLFHLHMSGDIMVVGHQGNQNVWGLSDKFLPEWAKREELSESEFDRQTALRALKALGTATPTELNYYFVRGRYNDLRGTLKVLLEESLIRRVRVAGFGNRDERYVLDRDVALLEALDSERLEPRMSLLPPFDNLICSTNRTGKLFEFDYVREQFLPEEKRKYGTYVLPILWGDKLIGRIDPRMDRETERMIVNSVHAESGAPSDRETVQKIRDTIQQLSQFLGANEVKYSSKVPSIWKNLLN